MFKKLLIKLALKYYVNKDIEIKRIPTDRLLDLYMLDTRADTLEVIKALMSDCMLKYFDASSDEERAMLKGGIVMLKRLKDRNTLAVNIADNIPDKERALKYWNKGIN